jgi:FkbM family methyltransferase
MADRFGPITLQIKPSLRGNRRQLADASECALFCAGAIRMDAMVYPPRAIGFVLAATEHGTMILNRFDYHNSASGTYGVGHVLLSGAIWHPSEVGFLVRLLASRRTHFGDGVVAIDCGANIGVHSLEWARSMTGWGSVISIEAQERIFYALAGNIALNNCFNARAIFAAVSATVGTLRVPTPNYLAPGSFASLELKQAEGNEFIGQKIDYSPDALTDIPAITIDSLNLPRLDLLKVDVERMEMEVLEGAKQTIARCLPVIFVEHAKTGVDVLFAALSALGYRVLRDRTDMVAIHPSDPTLEHVKVNPA